MLTELGNVHGIVTKVPTYEYKFYPCKDLRKCFVFDLFYSFYCSIPPYSCGPCVVQGLAALIMQICQADENVTDGGWGTPTFSYFCFFSETVYDSFSATISIDFFELLIIKVFFFFLKPNLA